MTSGRNAGTLAVIAVLCVLTIFFFPAMQGPYSVVHGPVTALLSVRAAAALRGTIVRAGLYAACGCLSFAHVALAPLSWKAFPDSEFKSNQTFACGSILRC